MFHGVPQMVCSTRAISDAGPPDGIQADDCDHDDDSSDDDDDDDGSSDDSDDGEERDSQMHRRRLATAGPHAVPSAILKEFDDLLFGLSINSAAAGCITGGLLALARNDVREMRSAVRSLARQCASTSFFHEKAPTDTLDALLSVASHGTGAGAAATAAHGSASAATAAAASAVTQIFVLTGLRPAVGVSLLELFDDDMNFVTRAVRGPE